MALVPSRPFTLNLSKTTQAYFREGNYTTAAMVGTEQEWETWASLGLIGCTQRAVAGLEPFQDLEEARFYLAVAHWIGGADERAIDILTTLSSPHAQNLLRLISLPKIRILSQLPWYRGTRSDLLTAARKDSKFELQNIGYHADDLPVQAYANIHDSYDANHPPDFYLCVMVEYHYLAPNLAELPCPIVGHTADFDMHIQAVHPWLPLFDELVVTDGTEWEALRGICDQSISTMPKVFGVPALPDGVNTDLPRTLDVFYSGTVLHAYYPEKTKTLWNLLSNAPLMFGLYDGFFKTDAEYFQQMSISKTCYAFTKHSGCTMTRALEAALAGCTIIVPQENILRLYVSPEDGLILFDPHGVNLPDIMEQVIEHWDDISIQQKHVNTRICTEFQIDTAASQYLRYCTFLAARPRPPRPSIDVNALLQARGFIFKGWYPESWKLVTQVFYDNIARLGARMEVAPSPEPAIHVLREVTCDYYAKLWIGVDASGLKPLLENVQDMALEQCVIFPDSLVLRFNTIRSILHFGNRQRVETALNLLQETLARDPDTWRISPEESIMPWDFIATFFNYRQYLDLVNLQWGGGNVMPQMIRLIRASLSYYLGHYSQQLGHFRMAMELDVEFPFYSWEFARRLARLTLADATQSEKVMAQATLILERLVEGSQVFLQAAQLLEDLHRDGQYSGRRLPRIRAGLSRINSTLKPLDPTPECPLQFAPPAPI